MLAAASLDPLLAHLCAGVVVVLLLGLLAQRLGQPSIVGYIAAGLVLGPHGLAWLDDPELAGQLGSLGVLLLMFFVGMEISPRELAGGWRVSVVGTLLQVATSVAAVWAIGAWLDWPLARIVLLGFVVSLSSTAVVLRILQTRGELTTPVGRDVVGVLIAQDLLIIAMLIAIDVMARGPEGVAPLAIAIQVAAGVALCAVMLGALRRPFSLPLGWVGDNKEGQVFVALLACFGLAALVGACGLPTALGAFCAGILITAARETYWVHEVLEPFRVLFVALFFVSVGMLLDLDFIASHPLQVGLLLLAVLVTNTLINAGILRALGRPWSEALYAGALLAQVGEFSFVLITVGRKGGLIADFAYQATLAVIVLSLALSPLWIGLFRRSGRPDSA